MTLPFEPARISPKHLNRRSFIGGSDARIVMGSDEAALLRLWREKRGEAAPEDLSDNLIVQLGLVTEPLKAAGPAPGYPLDGSDPRRDGCADRRRLRGQIHAALVVLGGGRGPKIRAAAPAQYVGHKRQGGGALDYHWRRQVGGDHHPGRSPLPASPAHGREKVLALR